MTVSLHLGVPVQEWQQRSYGQVRKAVRVGLCCHRELARIRVQEGRSGYSLPYEHIGPSGVIPTLYLLHVCFTIYAVCVPLETVTLMIETDRMRLVACFECGQV